MQLLLSRDALVEALKQEVIRLRRWRFGRSSEVIDASVAPELPLADGATSAEPLTCGRRRSPKIPKLMAVDTPRVGTMRPSRALIAAGTAAGDHRASAFELQLLGVRPAP